MSQITFRFRHRIRYSVSIDLQRAWRKRRSTFAVAKVAPEWQVN
jgi:hypothetical protein